MNDFKEIFNAYGGDYDMTMERLMGNVDLYMKFLCQFMDEPCIPKLEKSVKEKDYTEIFDAAHTIKGVSANLGLTPLYEAVCNIVEPLRQKKTDVDYDQLFQKVKQALQEVEELRDKLLEVWSEN